MTPDSNKWRVLSTHKPTGGVAGSATENVTEVGSAYYQFRQYEQVKSNPANYIKEDEKKIINSISQYMVLPSDETPSISIVTDSTKLKDNIFFKNAQNGDKVIVYTQAQKGILYRPSSNKIINFVSFINLLSPAPSKKQYSWGFGD